jgi:hypothetical protein
MAKGLEDLVQEHNAMQPQPGPERSEPARPAVGRMVSVEILESGRYADFETVPGKCGAKQRAAGDVVVYPDWYANDLIETGVAREPVEEQPYVPPPPPVVQMPKVERRKRGK